MAGRRVGVVSDLGGCGDLGLAHTLWKLWYTEDFRWLLVSQCYIKSPENSSSAVVLQLV